MASGRAMDGVAYRRVLGVLRGGTVAGWSDADLLERFRTREGEVAELAFAALVERHGTMVLRTCRAALGHLATSQADDAFQAVFLVLARRSGSIRAGDSIGPWLRQVALRVCRNARRVAERRASHEMASARDGIESRSEHASDGWPELHEELHRLPSRFREPLALCYLDGLTHDQAAARLGWPLGTVRSRLARGRERLKAALLRRGVSPAVALSLHLPRLSPLASALVPNSLREATIRNAVRLGRDASTALPAGLALLVGEGIRQTTIPGIKLMLTLVTAGLFSAALAFVPAQTPGEPKPAQATPAPRVLTIPIPSPGGRVRIAVEGPDGQESYAIVADGQGSFEVTRTGVKDQVTEIRTLHADGILLHPGPLKAEAGRVNKQLYDASEQVNFRGPEDDLKILSDRVALRQEAKKQHVMNRIHQMRIDSLEKDASKIQEDLKAREEALKKITLTMSLAPKEKLFKLTLEERTARVAVEQTREQLKQLRRLIEIEAAKIHAESTLTDKAASKNASDSGIETIETLRNQVSEEDLTKLRRKILEIEQEILTGEQRLLVNLREIPPAGDEADRLQKEAEDIRASLVDLKLQHADALKWLEDLKKQAAPQTSRTDGKATTKAVDPNIQEIQKQAAITLIEIERLQEDAAHFDDLVRKLAQEVSRRSGKEKEELESYLKEWKSDHELRQRDLQELIKKRNSFLNQLPDDSPVRKAIQKQIDPQPAPSTTPKAEPSPKPDPGASIKPPARELTLDERIHLEQIDKKLDSLSKQRDILDAEGTWHKANRRRLRLMEAQNPKPALSEEIRKSELRIKEIEGLLQVSDRENVQLLTDRVQLLGPDADRNPASNRPRLKVVIRGDRESKVGETHDYKLLVSLPGPPLTPGTLRVQLPKNVELLRTENRSGGYDPKTREVHFSLESIQPALEIGLQLRHTAPGLAILHASATSSNLTGTDSLVTKVQPR